MTRIVVTGGSGKAGRAVVHDLVEHGHAVVNVDVVPSSIPEAPFLRADLTDLGETIEALRGADVVVHLAAIPAPRIRTVERTFEINILSTYNVFSAAALLGLERVVWASSETVLGLPFGRREARNLLDPAAEPGHHPEPDYAPIDEEHPLRPHSSYSLTKVMGEEMARQFARWTHIPFIGLRFSAIREPAEYAAFPDGWSDPLRSAWNMWAYVDARDVAQACRLSLTADLTGAEAFIIAAGDTVMDRPNRELMAEVYPSVPLRPGTGDFDTLLSIDKARRLLGYDPAHSWRDSVEGTGRGRCDSGQRELGDGHHRGRIDQPVHRLRGGAAPGRPDRPARQPGDASGESAQVRIEGARVRTEAAVGLGPLGDREEARLEIGVAVDRTAGRGRPPRCRGRRRGRPGHPAPALPAHRRGARLADVPGLALPLRPGLVEHPGGLHRDLGRDDPVPGAVPGARSGARQVAPRDGPARSRLQVRPRRARLPQAVLGRLSRGSRLRPAAPGRRPARVRGRHLQRAEHEPDERGIDHPQRDLRHRLPARRPGRRPGHRLAARRVRARPAVPRDHGRRRRDLELVGARPVPRMGSRTGSAAPAGCRSPSSPPATTRGCSSRWSSTGSRPAGAPC